MDERRRRKQELRHEAAILAKSINSAKQDVSQYRTGSAIPSELFADMHILCDCARRRSSRGLLIGKPFGVLPHALLSLDRPYLAGRESGSFKMPLRSWMNAEGESKNCGMKPQFLPNQ